MGMSYDISARKRAEEALHDANARLEERVRDQRRGRSFGQRQLVRVTDAKTSQRCTQSPRTARQFDAVSRPGPQGFGRVAAVTRQPFRSRCVYPLQMAVVL